MNFCYLKMPRNQENKIVRIFCSHCHHYTGCPESKLIKFKEHHYCSYPCKAQHLEKTLKGVLDSLDAFLYSDDESNHSDENTNTSSSSDAESGTD